MLSMALRRTMDSGKRSRRERGTMDFENLSPELQEKVMACETPEDILALAKEQNYKLSDDELEGIAGGGWKPWKDGVGSRR